VRLLAETSDGIPDEVYRKVTKDRSAAVRREALLALRNEKPAKAGPLVLGLAKAYEGNDRFYLEALGIAVGKDSGRRERMLRDFSQHFPEWNTKVADLVWELRPAPMMTRLRALLQDKTLPTAQRIRVLDILASSDDGAAGTLVVHLLQTELPEPLRDSCVSTLQRFLPGKWSSLRIGPALAAVVRQLLRSADTREGAIGLIAASALEEFLSEVVAVARNSQETSRVRTKAIEALASLPATDAQEALAALLRTGPPALQAVAAQSLGARGTSAARQSLEEAVLNSRTEISVRQAAVAALTSSRQGTQWLLDATEHKLLSDDLSPEVGRLTRNSPYKDLRNRALKAFPPSARLDPNRLPPIANFLTRRGDAARGSRLLARSTTSDLQCLKCHTIHGEGGKIGPDLSSIGKKASHENLYESILYPSKAIADQYLTWVIETTDGLSIRGLLVEETPDQVTLRDANGKDARVAKVNIESRSKSPVSIMPADSIGYMSETDLVDIVEYLYSLKGNGE
jgi:putative heme-binding domain-containing protein